MSTGYYDVKRRELQLNGVCNSLEIRHGSLEDCKNEAIKKAVYYGFKINYRDNDIIVFDK